MQTLKGALFVFAGLFGMVMIISFMIPSQVVTVRGMPVHASPEKILAEISDLKQWKQWHPVFMHDSSAVVSKPSTGIHAAIEWKTRSVVNKIIITESNASGIRFLLQRTGENDVEHLLSLAPLQDSTGYQVEWKALTKLKWYPWEKFGGMFTDKLTGPGYEAALTNLRDHIEGRKH